MCFDAITHIVPPPHPTTLHSTPPHPNPSYREPEKSADLGTETESATDQQLCYHVLGTPQSQDVVVWAIPEHPTWMSSAEVSDDGK
jgi:hypothetical protein